MIFGAGDFGLAITHSGPSGVSSTDSNEVMSGGGPSTIGTSPRAIWVQRRASRKSLGERFTFPGKFPSLRRADRSSLEGGILKSHFGGGSTPHKRVGEENGKVIVSARAGQATERTC